MSIPYDVEVDLELDQVASTLSTYCTTEDLIQFFSSVIALSFNEQEAKRFLKDLVEEVKMEY